MQGREKGDDLVVEIYKVTDEQKEYVEGLLQLLSQPEMGEVKNVLQMVLFEDGSVAIDAGKYSMSDLMLFKGHLELSVMRRYLTANGCPRMEPDSGSSGELIGFDEMQPEDEDEEEDPDGDGVW